MFALYKMKVHLKLEPFELYCSLWWWSTWSKENHIAYNHLATSHAHAKETHVYSPVLLRLVFPHTRVLPFWWELVGAHGTTLYQCIMFHLCLNSFFLSSFLPFFQNWAWWPMVCLFPDRGGCLGILAGMVGSTGDSCEMPSGYLAMSKCW